MIDYTPIFNKMTVEGIEKFIELNELGKQVNKGKNKGQLCSNLVETLQKDSYLEEQFQGFYRKIEEAGRKHFFLYKINYSKEIKKRVESQLALFIPEKSRAFDPIADDGKIYYSSTSNEIVIKRIRIRKIYELLGVKESDSKLVRTYTVNNIYYIEFVRFNFRNNTVFMGYDAHGELFERRVIEKEFFAFVSSLIGESEFNSVESLITSEKLERIRHNANCIVFSLSNSMNTTNKTTFSKSRGDVDRILQDVKHGKYKISAIKDNNPDFDVQTHPAFEASLEKSIEDDMEISNNGLEIFHFTEKLGKPFAFRYRVDQSRDLLITFSDSVTKEELEDVFIQFS